MDFNENFKRQMSAWPKKISSVMDIHRQRFTQLNKKLKPQSMHYPVVAPPPPPPPVSSSPMYSNPVRQSARPQPRQQARSKEQQPLSAYRYQPSPTANQQYLTLENLSKVFHVFQTRVKSTAPSDAATDTSTSTTTSAKHRSHQHLQRTATRWWTINRNIESPSISNRNPNEEISTIRQHSEEAENLPIIVRRRTFALKTIENLFFSSIQTIVSNSSQKMNPKYDESEITTDLSRGDFIQPFKTRNLLPSNRQEPLIMQARGMRLPFYDRHIYAHTNHQMNFFQHQRLIRQT